MERLLKTMYWTKKVHSHETVKVVIAYTHTQIKGDDTPHCVKNNGQKGSVLARARTVDTIGNTLHVGLELLEQCTHSLQPVTQVL